MPPTPAPLHKRLPSLLDSLTQGEFSGTQPTSPTGGSDCHEVPKELSCAASRVPQVPWPLALCLRPPEKAGRRSRTALGAPGEPWLRARPAEHSQAPLWHRSKASHTHRAGSEATAGRRAGPEYSSRVTASHGHAKSHLAGLPGSPGRRPLKTLGLKAWGESQAGP